MSFAIETVTQALAWLRGELLISIALAGLLIAPGAVLCWFAYHVTGVRLAPGATRPARFRRRQKALDRLEQRLANLCTALSILTDSTESGLRAAISGLERLSGSAVEPLPVDGGALEAVAAPAPAVIAAHQGRSAREIAIAEGISEGEVRLRLHLQGT